MNSESKGKTRTTTRSRSGSPLAPGIGLEELPSLWENSGSSQDLGGLQHSNLGNSGLDQELDSELRVSGFGQILDPSLIRVIPTSEALKNQDILNLIFEYFDLQPGSQTIAQTRKDLLSAAKTCKAFAEPALNSLWRVIPSLLPLLLLLPSAEVYNGHYFIDELPSLENDPIHQQSDWERLNVHARRVRTLYMEPLRVVISPNIYLRIGAMRRSPLLPGLSKIYIPDNPSESLDLSSALFLASGSALDMVQLDGNAISDRQFFVPFLSSLHVKSPGLTHLTLRGVVKTSVELICRFTKLQSLELRLCNPLLHPQILQQLGQLRHLLELIIDTGSSRDIATSVQCHTNPASINDSKFRLLRRLEILGTATSTSRILNEIKGLVNLTTLKIDEVWDGGTDSSTDKSWRSCFEAISTFSAVENIEITHALDRPRGQYVLWASSLAPFFRLHNMKSFVINFNNGAMSASDDDLRQLADAFPKLKKIIVPPPLNYRGGTLACLYHFSSKCPDLREIKIGLSQFCDISANLEAIKKLPQPIVRNYRHPLEKLYIDSDFGQLKPIELVQVARFLDLVFPSLLILETGDTTTLVDAANWAGIYEFGLALRDARVGAFLRGVTV